MSRATTTKSVGAQVIIQVVSRGKSSPQYTITIPRAIAQAMGFQKGEAVDLRIEDGKLILQRQPTKMRTVR